MNASFAASVVPFAVRVRACGLAASVRNSAVSRKAALVLDSKEIPDGLSQTEFFRFVSYERTLAAHPFTASR